MSLPTDRSHLSTEHRHADSEQLDALATEDCVQLMVQDHARVQRAVADAAPAITAFIDDLVPRMRGGGRLVYIGAGTSGRLGVLDASECPPTFRSDPDQIVGIIAGGDSSLRRSSEAMEDDPYGACSAFDQLELNAADTVLGIAAGGTTPYVLGGIRHAATRGCVTGLLTCATIDPAVKVNHPIQLDTGPELLTGSTRLKAGTATKLVLNIITTTAFVQLGKVFSNLMVDLRPTNAKLLDRAIRVLVHLCPRLSRSEAALAIERAGGDLKTAIVMQRLTVEREQAIKLLHENDGLLRDVFKAHERP